MCSLADVKNKFRKTSFTVAVPRVVRAKENNDVEGGGRITASHHRLDITHLRAHSHEQANT